MSLSRDQAKFTDDLARTILWTNAREDWGPDKEWYVKILEVHRSLEQQKIHVANGVSKTLKSDHLESRAGDIQIYHNGRPVWAPEHYKPIGEHFCSLDPKNYWGFAEWGWDAPHMGRRR